MSRRRGQVKKRIVERRVIVGIEDMILLRDVRDRGIVDNLKDRLEAEQIYTFIGHVLVVCNPYKWLRIYEKDIMKQYVLQSRVDVPPHIFATAESAYRSMILDDELQCVIISGESGAGKTEASKQIQAYIANVCGGGEGVDAIKRVFLESNPVLEAFGNAKTLRNNNSSRFGKYFELKFNRFGQPQGGLITNYLLEKSRIVKPGSGERNFHIFYQLLATAHKSKFQLEDRNSYHYLSVSNCFEVDGVNDAEEFDTTVNALKSVGMSNAQIQAMLSIVAAILHLGNVQFRSVQVEGVEGSAVANKAALNKFCELVSIDPTELENVLITRELQTMAPGGKVELYKVPQTPTQAQDRRDAICKSLYERMFDLIVSRINVALDPGTEQETKKGDMLSIGVLDIYGFEVFQNNGFEQMCINYVNEKLQQIFIELTLRSEQEEYEREGIAWTPIPFFNNKIVCELLDSSKPPGIFRILDDTCKTMHGTKSGLDVDLKFMETCSQLHSKHAHYSRTTNNFTIKHYAGDVTYSAGKFAESNKDALGKDLVAMLKTSSNKLVTHLFPEVIDYDDKKQPPTAGNKIRVQCQDLVTALMSCAPHYVRCIKSNDHKQALTIDMTRVQHQAKYLGLSENIKVRRAGFAYRAEYHRFLDRFAILSKKTYPEWVGTDKNGCKEILKAVQSLLPNMSEGEIQLGKSKVFVRQPETYFDLEKLRENKLGDFVAVIQRTWRNYCNKKVFYSVQNNINKIYAEAGKARRRDSVFRPYLGDYLHSLESNPTALATLRDNIFRIIDYYDDQENIIFSDGNCWRLVSDATNENSVIQQQFLLIMTNGAIYIIERTNKTPDVVRYPKLPQGTVAAPEAVHGVILPPEKTLPDLILRRRIPLDKKFLQGITLTNHADSAIVLNISPQQALATPNIVHWKKDEEVKECPTTGKPFGLFTRRHHCRLSGGIFSSLACNFRQNLPDFGHYAKPELVNDTHIGLASIDILEDILLFCDKKSELVAHLTMYWSKANNNSKLPITFSSNPSLRLSAVPQLSRTPNKSITFRTSGTMADESFDVSVNGNTLSVTVPTGLSHEVVADRQKAKAQRRKKAEVRRQKQEAARRERQAQKEEEREQERLLAQEQKRARKAQEQEARRLEEESKATTKSVTKPRGKQFGAAASDESKPSGNAPAKETKGADNELAAAMARRRAKVA